MISGVASMRVAAESTVIVGITRRKRPQAVGREQFPLHDIQYSQGQVLFKNRMRKADGENLVGTDGAVRPVVAQYVVKASGFFVPEGRLESGMRALRQSAIMRGLVVVGESRRQP